jgi:hypothetical protein
MYLRPKGYSVVTDGWGIETREDTTKCWHCQRIMFFAAGQDPNEFSCRSCMMPICPDCANKPCDHWEKKIERAEATDRYLWRKFGEKVERCSTANELLRIQAAMERERFLRDAGV